MLKSKGIGVNCPKIKIGVICHFFRASVRFPILILEQFTSIESKESVERV